MSEIADEIEQSETYHKKVAAATPVWRIRHPERRYYAAFLVVSGQLRVTPGHLGLVHREPGPPEDALQFGRRRDAELFAQAYLDPSIDWRFEPTPAPPRWAEAQP